MKLLIMFVLIFIIQFALAHGGITVKKWEWWVVTIGYCVYAALYRADFQRRYGANMTRFEKIKPMNIDEFADYFMGPICTCMEDCPKQSCSCHQCVKNWLEEEVEE